MDACEWYCSKEEDKTQQVLVFLPLQEIFSPLRATAQLAVHKKNMFAPDQKSLKIEKKRK
jgi:hypothetical protein